MSRRRIYLDANAGTAIDPRILEELLKELENEEGNPSSIHFHGRQLHGKLEESRRLIAQFFSVRPNEIIFTSGGTEGAFLLLNGAVSQFPSGHIISSSAEHSCVYETLKQFEKKGFRLSLLPPGSYGAPQAEDVRKAICPDTRLITLMAANNETGVKTDIAAIADIALEHRIPFVVDGVALLGKEAFAIPNGASALFFSGHKFHAPKGIGFCICRQTFKIQPLFRGGNQEYHRRAGTENLPGIVSLAKAIAILDSEQAEITQQLRQRRDLLEKTLQDNLSGVHVNGEGPRIVNTSNLSFEGVDGEALLLNLDLEGISASHGSACSSGALEPSRVILNMGISKELARSAIRFSVGRNTTEQEIIDAADCIVKIVNRLRT
ncbi:MAG: cysteine desulfurase [Parachlamydia sp.]|jgi:cysteine desulfurase|nr:cysteine desulfurase [Parachlamydia sp.]